MESPGIFVGKFCMNPVAALDRNLGLGYNTMTGLFSRALMGPK